MLALRINAAMAPAIKNAGSRHSNTCAAREAAKLPAPPFISRRKVSIILRRHAENRDVYLLQQIAADDVLMVLKLTTLMMSARSSAPCSLLRRICSCFWRSSARRRQRGADDLQRDMLDLEAITQLLRRGLEKGIACVPLRHHQVRCQRLPADPDFCGPLNSQRAGAARTASAALTRLVRCAVANDLQYGICFPCVDTAAA